MAAKNVEISFRFVQCNCGVALLLFDRRATKLTNPKQGVKSLRKMARKNGWLFVDSRITACPHCRRKIGATVQRRIQYEGPKIVKDETSAPCAILAKPMANN